MLVAVYEGGGIWSGFFGFETGTEYRVLSPSTGFSFSTVETQVKVGETFTVQFKAANISDLAGWHGDIVFDPTVLKANSVSEGDFLKQNSGRTHFLRGTIDNIKGRITGIGAARLSKGGVNGEGTLLALTFTAKAQGESRLLLRKFQAGASSGEIILARPADIVITARDSSVSEVVDDIFSLATGVTPVRFGDTFTLRLTANDVTNLAGWQTDISFDPDVLEAVEVSEGDFLNVKSGDTFFLRGTIDNTAGQITGISTAKLKGSGSGTGTLLLVTFNAKSVGDTRVTLRNFFAGSSNSETISSDAPAIAITIEDSVFLAWDVNQDGQVNILDLILVAQHFGERASANPQTDVNGDGNINVLDLITVAQHFGESTAAAAPSHVDIENLELDPTMIQAWIAQAQIEDDGSIAFREGIAFLQGLLALLIPEETALLANYPNPFNPETWIPYHLANPSEVTITIYDMRGTIVRQLNLGHQRAGIYTGRGRAAYWDGRNDVGERVASGIYFYRLTAGDFTATRKMLIRK